MANRRVSKTKALVSGRAAHDPGRFRRRNSPAGLPPLGDPPQWMNPLQKSEWLKFRAELPWLNASHTALLEIACTIRARVVTGGEVGVCAMNLLRQCLSQLGATPADATKVTVPGGDEEDPDDAFLSGRVY